MARILIKIGSALISKNNKVDYDFLERKINEISKLLQENEIILITSGAVAAGMEIESLNQRPKDTLELQLLSGIGQIKLMEDYKLLFSEKKITISQVLLTHHNFDNEEEQKTIANIINSYLKQKVIPIINENDLVNKEEFESEYKFSDNDILTAFVASLLKPDLVLILTDVNGLYNANPKTTSNPEFIELVEKIQDEIKQMASKETNHIGLGGMYSKIIAAEIINKKGIDVIVANGNFSINDIIENKVKRTLFKG
ncbi:MAG: glutamate 5-kinase [Nanoarchaeota archaeon]|nr:glutamate 5-kinase [Nanoarchaeota archaeon]